MASNRISLILDFSGTAARASIDAVNRSMQSMEHQADRSGRKISQSMDGVSLSIKGVIGQFNYMKGVMLGVMGAALLWPLKMAADMERAYKSLTVLLGGMREASVVIGQIAALSLTSPFAFKELKDTTTMLVAFGFRGREISGVLRSVTDAAAGVGGTVEKLQQISLAIGQIKVKGRLNAEEINKQLGEAGIPASKYLAEALSKEMGQKVTVDQTMKLAENQRLNAEVGVGAILEGMNKQFGGLGKQLATDSVYGMFNKLVDQANYAGIAIGQSLSKETRAAIEGLTSLATSVRGAAEAFRDMPDWVRRTVVALVALSAVLAAIAVAGKLGVLTLGLSNLAMTARMITQVGLVGTLSGITLATSNLAVSVGAVSGAFAGWKLGEWVRDNLPDATKFSKWMQDKVWAKLGFATTQDQDRLGDIGNQGKFLEENLRKRYAEMMRKQYPDEVPQRISNRVRDRFAGLDRMPLEERMGSLRMIQEDITAETQQSKKSLLKKNDEEIEALYQKARAKVESARREGATGMFRVGPEYSELFRETREASGGIPKALMEKHSVEEALGMLSQAARLEVDRERRKFAEEWQKSMREYLKGLDDETEKTNQFYAKRYQTAQEYVSKTLEFELETLRKSFAYREDLINADRDKQLRSVQSGGINAVTVPQKQALEGEKAQIEINALKQVSEVRLSLLNADIDRQIKMVEAEASVEIDIEIKKLERISAVRVAYESAQLRRRALGGAQGPLTPAQAAALSGQVGAMQSSEASSLDAAKAAAVSTALPKYTDRIKAIEQDAARQRTELATTTENDVTRIREDAAIRQAEIARDANQKVFDSLKRQAEGVLDAMLSKSTNVFSAMANAFKVAFLTAIKDVVSSRVAAMLMDMFTGTKTRFVHGQGTGLAGTPVWGQVAAMAGPAAMMPGMAAGAGGGGGMSGGMLGGLPIGYNPVAMYAGMGAPGGTSGFSGPVGYSGGAPAAGGAGGFGGFGGLGNIFSKKSWNLASLQNMGGAAATMIGLGLLQSGITKNSAGRTIAGGATMGAGIGLMGGPIGAVGGLGIGLGAAGLQRGGWSGVGMTTSGGALLGLNIGGPIGAAIGAGAGFVAGLIRLGIKGNLEHTRDLVKQVYGIDIQERSILQKIVDIAKQSYAGSISTAVYSSQVRELVELYAQSRGQKFFNQYTPRAASLVQSGGQLNQSAFYVNGSAYKFQSSLPTIGASNVDTIGTGSPAYSAAPSVIQLDSNATTSLLQGRAVSLIAPGVIAR